MTDAVGDGGEQPARSPDDEWGGGGRVSMGQFWELPAVRAAEFSFNSGYVLAVTDELVTVQLYDAWTDSGGDFRFERSKEVRTLGLTELRTTGTWKAHASVYDAMGGPLVEPMRQVLQGSEEFSAGVMVRIEFKDGRVCIGCQSGHVAAQLRTRSLLAAPRAWPCAWTRLWTCAPRCAPAIARTMTIAALWPRCTPPHAAA